MNKKCPYRSHGLWQALLICLPWLISSAQGKDPLGLICFLSGEIHIRDSGKKDQPARLYDTVREDSIIRAGAESITKIILFSGDAYEISGPARAILRQGKLKRVEGQIRYLPPVTGMPEVALFDQTGKPGNRMAALRIRSDLHQAIDPREDLTFTSWMDGNPFCRLRITDTSGKEIFSSPAGERNSCVVPAGTLFSRQQYFLNVWAEEGKTRHYLHRQKPLQTLGKEDSHLRKTLRDQYKQTGDVALLLLLAELDRQLLLSGSARQEFQEAMTLYPKNPALQDAADRFEIRK